jgi:uncharacterized protein YndB with AHSA1/START domain
MADATESISIEHFFDAPLAETWRAWTEPSIVALWWGSDPDGVVTSAALDVRSGGAFEISFRDSDGDGHTCLGEYLRVEPMAELDFTWAWRDEPDAPSRIRVVFAAEGDGTRVGFLHGELTGDSAHDYAEGWRRTFAKLDRVFDGEMEAG